MIMTMPNFTYVRPKSLKETFPHLSAGNARIHAGGTDLLGCLRDGVFTTEKVVSISQLDKLKRVERLKDGSFRIGALATITELANHALVGEFYPALAQAALEVASPQLRNQGTIGGNLCQKPRCWYYRGEFHCTRKGGDRCFAVAGENQYHCVLGGRGCYIVHPSDIAPVLMAYGASIEIAGARRTKKIPVDKLFVLPEQAITKETVIEPGEVLTAVLLPPVEQGFHSSYRKVRARASWDFALAGVALALRFQERKVARARIVLSGAAPIPWRCPDSEKVITGQSLNDEIIARAAAAAMREAQPMRHNEYKIELFKGLIAEELAAYKRS
jgi:xanthine dehydrogenase YagS FAD-binding subunit